MNCVPLWFFSLQPSSELCLSEREKKLREEVDTLNKTKFDRQKRLKRLAEMEIGLCKTVGEKSKLSSAVASKTVPSEQQLEEFRKRINDLENTRVRGYANTSWG